jgi:hypothetical protein
VSVPAPRPTKPSSTRSLRALVVGAIGLACASLTGCEVVLGTCGEELRDKGAALYTEGTTANGVYRSSSWDAEDLVEFAPGQVIRFEHGLGVVPASYEVYVTAARTGDGSELVPASGDQVELVSIDDEAITVHNDTCSDWFILLVAEAEPTP